MVLFTLVLRACPKGLSKKTKFVDRLRVFVKGGTGGQGLAKYGGLGGDGGNVIFEAAEKGTLFDLTQRYPEKRFHAKAGSNSKRMALMGSSGEDIIISVPPGVTLSLDSGEKIGDLNKPGQKVVVAEGGQGGGPYNSYRYTRGHTRSVSIDLKLLADVGLVGFPNAGKSTFLSAVSRAKPKVADYPFTTLRPHLGNVTFPDNRQITIADLPGLIEGAHANVGMGHFFLKHVERTKLLLLVVDINGFVLNVKSPERDALQTVYLLNKELELYKPELLDKPHMLLINKMDSSNAQAKYDELYKRLQKPEDYIDVLPEELRPERLFNFQAIQPMSAACDDLQPIIDRVRKVIDDSKTASEDEVTERLDKFIQDTTEKNFHHVV